MRILLNRGLKIGSSLREMTILGEVRQPIRSIYKLGSPNERRTYILEAAIEVVGGGQGKSKY